MSRKNKGKNRNGRSFEKVSTLILICLSMIAVSLQSVKAVSTGITTHGRVRVLWEKEVGFQLMDVKIGDIDGDGRKDVVVAPSENKIVAVDSFGSLLWSHPTNRWVWDVAVGDVDGDGQNDVVGYDYQEPNLVYAIDSSGDLLWQCKLPDKHGSTGVTSVAISDVNGDHRNEVLIGVSDLNCVYALNRTGGVMWNCTTPSSVTSMKIRDIDGDGLGDIVVSSGYSGLGWLTVLDGWGVQLWNYTFSQRVGESVYGDLNNDGKDEVIVIDSVPWERGNVYAINNSGKSLLWNYTLPHSTSSLAIGDVNGDGDEEVVAAAYGHIYVMSSYGQLIGNYLTGMYSNKVAVGDIDYDRISDIVTCSSSHIAGLNIGYVMALKGSGELIWNVTGSAYFRDCEIGDVNGDGRNDVVVISDDRKLYLLTTVDPSRSMTTMSLSGILKDNDWFTSDVTITLSATGPTKVDKTEYSFDNVTWNTYTTPFNIVKEGKIFVYYKSTDENGTSEAIQVNRIKVDKTTPSGSIIINNNATYTTSPSVTLNLTAADATSGLYQVRLSSGGVWDTEPWESPSQTKTWTLLFEDGMKTVYYQIKDKAGLISPTYSDKIILDTTAPTISITSPINASEMRSSNSIVAWTGSDITSGMSCFQIRLDGGPWINLGTNMSYTLAGLGDGGHTVDVRASDKAGLSKQGSVNFTINTSLLFGPGWIDDIATFGGIALLFALILLRTRKTSWKKPT